MTTPPTTGWPVELFCWAPAEVTVHQNRNALITNSPLAFAAFYGARAAGNHYMKKKAAQQAQAAWRELGPGQFFIDQGGIQLSGQWGQDRLEFGEIMSWNCSGQDLTVQPLDPDREPIAVRSPNVQAIAQCFQSFSAGRLWLPPRLEPWSLRGDEQSTGWEQRDIRFVFGLFPGWESVTDPSYFNDLAQYSAAHGQRFLMLLRCGYQNGVGTLQIDELVDPDALQQVNAERQYYIRCANNLVKSRVDSSTGQILNPPRTVSVGGEPGAMLSYSRTHSDIVTRMDEIYVGHGPVWLNIQSGFGTRSDPEPLWLGPPNDFMAMVASWQWRL